MNWKTIEKDGPPPFDTLCIVSGTRYCKGFIEETETFLNKTDEGWTAYCLAYNELYRPEIMMTQVLEIPDNCTLSRDNDSVYLLEVPFEIEKWCEVDE